MACLHAEFDEGFARAVGVPIGGSEAPHNAPPAENAPSLTMDTPPVLQFAPTALQWTTEEDGVLLRHALRHGTRQWGRLVRSQQLPTRGNKACCNRFLFLKKKFAQRIAAHLPAQQGAGRGAEQGLSVSHHVGQPQRHMWSRAEVALQFGALSLEECVRLFLPPAHRGILSPPEATPENPPEDAPENAPENATEELETAPENATDSALDAPPEVAPAPPAAAAAAAGSQQVPAPMTNGDVVAAGPAQADAAGKCGEACSSMKRGVKRPHTEDSVCEADVAAVAAHASLRQALLSSANEQLLSAFDANRPAVSAALIRLLLQRKQQEQQEQQQQDEQQELHQQNQVQQQLYRRAASIRLLQSELTNQSDRPIQPMQSLPLLHKQSRVHCRGIDPSNSSAIPALAWPPVSPPPVTSQPVSSPLETFESMLRHSAPTPVPLATMLRRCAPTPAAPLASTPLASVPPPSSWPWASTCPVPFHSTKTQPEMPRAEKLPSFLPSTNPYPFATFPQYSPTSLPSSHTLRATHPVTSNSSLTPVRGFAPVTPTVLDPRLPLPSFPSLSALQSALHNAPPHTPPSLSDQHPSGSPSANHLSCSPSASHAASSNSVSPSPSSPSSLSSQRNIAPAQLPAAAAGAAVPISLVFPNSSRATRAEAALAAAALAQEARPLPAPSALPVLASTSARPHKMARTSRGVLPPAAVEFARSFFSRIPRSEDTWGAGAGSKDSSKDGSKDGCKDAGSLQPQELAGGTPPGEILAGESHASAATPLTDDRLSEVASVMLTEPVAMTEAPAAVAAAEGTTHGGLSIWGDLAALDGEGSNDNKEFIVGSFCALDELFGEDEHSNVAYL